MICDLCGANGHTQTVLSVYQTEKVKEVCSGCAGDLYALKANCRKLSDKTTAKINRRAAKIAMQNRSNNAFWSLVSASTVAIKNVFSDVKESTYVAGVAIGQAKLDDSDHPNGTRSGMIPKTDHKTGCQYLQAPFWFSITPRLDENGKPICGRVSQ